MATKKLVLVTSGPANGATKALEMATAMRRQGREVAVCLLQDGVLCVLHGNQTPAGAAAEQTVRAGVGVYYLEDDLIARGFTRGDVWAEAKPLGYWDLVDTLVSGEQTVLGAF